MELLACIKGLQNIPYHLNVTLYTDSRYVRDGITSWIKTWKKNNWRTAANSDVKNKDLWEELDFLNEDREITWQWVEAHSGIEGNERADILAKQGIVLASVKM